jgi:MinD-like ATPase involved in chromosome partitioning or flagellar assembly
LPRHEPSDAGGRGLPRPPWLPAHDAYGGMDTAAPRRDGGSGHRDAAPWAGNEPSDNAEPPAVFDDTAMPWETPESGDAAAHLMAGHRPDAQIDAQGAAPVEGSNRAHGHERGPNRGETNQLAGDHDGSQQPSSHRMSAPPWNIHAGQAQSGHDPAPQSPPPSSEPGVAPALPPGWPPGAPLPPAWWYPPGPPGWPPHPPPWPQSAPEWGGGGQSPPPRPRTVAIPGVQTFRMPPSLDEAKVVNLRTSAPRSGWRRAVHRATRGTVNPGGSRKDRAEEDLLAQIRRPIAGDFRIAVLSVKGGVGKTTTTVGLGSALAMVRRDRVIAVDANPDRGTLAERVRDTSTNSTVRDLLTDPHIKRYPDVRGHTRMAVSRLEVLASEQDPAAADVFGEADYRRTVDILGHYYNIILTDCGTGIMHSAMAGVLDLAHAIVLVSSPAMDAVTSASATLDWLTQHGHSKLVREGHVVLSATRPGSAALKLDRVNEFFEARCRSTHFIPFDPHLAEGADVDFAMLKPATRQGYLELAGAVAENFSGLPASY